MNLPFLPNKEICPGISNKVDPDQLPKENKPSGMPMLAKVIMASIIILIGAYVVQKTILVIPPDPPAKAAVKAQDPNDDIVHKANEVIPVRLSDGRSLGLYLRTDLTNMEYMTTLMAMAQPEVVSIKLEKEAEISFVAGNYRMRVFYFTEKNGALMAALDKQINSKVTVEKGKDPVKK